MLALADRAGAERPDCSRKARPTLLSTEKSACLPTAKPSASEQQTMERSERCDPDVSPLGGGAF
jgi:hypothetical protein